MLEKKLLEEVKRYNAINRYGKTMIMEADDAVPPPPPADPMAAGEPPVGGDLGGEEPPVGGEPAPDAAPAPAPDLGGEESTDTEEVDVTDLVDMVKNLKKDYESKQQDNTEVVSKMDDVFSKLGELEQKLASMDSLMSKIDQLGARVEEMKPETPQEKLEMRSLDSYPFNQKPQDFFANKQAEMRQAGKNEYVLTKDDVDNFSADEMKTSFNPVADQDEYSY